MLPPIVIPSNTSLAEGLYKGLKDAIVNGTLKPGDRLTEISVANHVNISRTPVREAFQKLQSEGMLEAVGRSLMVASMSLETLSELCLIRETLEGLAARLAAAKRDESEIFGLEILSNDIKKAVENEETDKVIRCNRAFHTFIWQISKNQHLNQKLLDLRKSISRMQASTLHSKERQLEMIKEHEEILEAIKSSNEELAERLTRKHFRKAENLRITMLRMKALTESN